MPGEEKTRPILCVNICSQLIMIRPKISKNEKKVKTHSPAKIVRDSAR